MTCIVGLVNDWNVYIWWDSAWVAWKHVIIRKDPKVFNVWRFIFGCTSSFRMIQLLRFKFKTPSFDGLDTYEYMCTKFIDEIKRCFKEWWCLEEKDKIDIWWTFLVWYEWRLFAVYDDFQVWEAVSWYASVWCWDVYALGSLYTTYSHYINAATAWSDYKCRWILTTALECAEHFSWGVKWPFTIINN